MKEKFIIEITDSRNVKWYFAGILNNQIQFSYTLEDAFKMNLSPCVTNYEMCKKKSYRFKLELNFEIKEL